MTDLVRMTWTIVFLFVECRTFIYVWVQSCSLNWSSISLTFPLFCLLFLQLLPLSCPLFTFFSPISTAPESVLSFFFHHFLSPLLSSHFPAPFYLGLPLSSAKKVSPLLKDVLDLQQRYHHGDSYRGDNEQERSRGWRMKWRWRWGNSSFMWPSLVWEHNSVGKITKRQTNNVDWLIKRQIKSKRRVKGSDGGRMKRKKVIEREEKREGRQDNEAWSIFQRPDGTRVLVSGSKTWREWWREDD